MTYQQWCVNQRRERERPSVAVPERMINPLEETSSRIDVALDSIFEEHLAQESLVTVLKTDSLQKENEELQDRVNTLEKRLHTLEEKVRFLMEI